MPPEDGSANHRGVCGRGGPGRQHLCQSGWPTPLRFHRRNQISVGKEVSGRRRSAGVPRDGGLGGRPTADRLYPNENGRTTIHGWATTRATC